MIGLLICRHRLRRSFKYVGSQVTFPICICSVTPSAISFLSADQNLVGFVAVTVQEICNPLDYANGKEAVTTHSLLSQPCFLVFRQDRLHSLLRALIRVCLRRCSSSLNRSRPKASSFWDQFTQKTSSATFNRLKFSFSRAIKVVGLTSRPQTQRGRVARLGRSQGHRRPGVSTR
jgi:hypothetical protein